MNLGFLRIGITLSALRIGLLVGAVLALILPITVAASGTSPTSSMSTTRFLHTSVLLDNGKVLMSGGEIVVGPDNPA